MLSGLVNDVKWVCETDLKLDQYKSDFFFHLFKKHYGLLLWHNYILKKQPLSKSKTHLEDCRRKKLFNHMFDFFFLLLRARLNFFIVVSYIKTVGVTKSVR